MLEFVDSAAQAVSRITDGATVLIGGFGNAGQPMELIDALMDSGATGLTVVNNNAGQADAGLALLIKERRVAKIICSFPRQSDSWHFDEAYRAGEIELELVPQGNLAERMRAAGAGIGGFFSPTGYGTQLAEGKEVREIDGKHYVLESPIRGDFALIKAYAADPAGNLVYRKTARNFGPVMATAAAHTIVQVDEVLEESLNPEHVVTPGIYVDTVVGIPTESGVKEREERAALAAGQPKPCLATKTAAELAAEK
ncbi:MULTISPECIES: 3-oxoacid CoA-transferase subunit A [Citricoccus]|uniref:3-oxoacid CoA-transferase subunit A n=1 Tax=Citricoccus alkalitolerans TaxID=246603 RepID=A0ABV8XXZ1_9MICC|nr:3-oxoacid CoA-transferase subunit A [Citricoccus sp.]NUL44492.1 3-oxoacid CoA-transferase subunit A [Cellulosimicrobium funkei]